ncbi:MAG: PDZ domain-containing protein, partial [candidate division Zixibacteria bacterium]|nr:PDZ domain-containing protein [candidate division Zixibacteria bacterium]
SPDRPLADWIAAEPYGSQLVKLTRPPKPIRRGPGPKQRQFVEGLPLAGELGFSVKLDESGRLMVSQIDTYRLAYANGLRESDRIFRVDGRRVKTQKAMVEHILTGLDNGGAILEIIREGNTETLLMQPIRTLDESDYYYLDAPDEFEADSVSTPAEQSEED